MTKSGKSAEKKPGANPTAGGEEAAKAKELRKLEWQKKLAEKKLQTNKENEGELSKAHLRLQRREQQEAQRSAKSQPKTPENKNEKKQQTADKPKEVAAKPVGKKIVKKSAVQANQVQLVNHLYTERMRKPEYEQTIVNYPNVHPMFVRLGVQYQTKQIFGSNARCLALLSAVKHLINDLKTPPKQDFCRYFETVLKSCVDYLQYCRPFAVSMTNALRHFKLQLTQEARKLPDNEQKAYLLNVIDTYVTDEIYKAAETITSTVKEKISKGDVIMTYGCSSLIKKILLDAHKDNKQFQVIVVDGRLFLEGRQMLQRLVQAGIQCSYVPITAISYVMNSVTKILLGAHALLANGYVMSRIGTSQIALMAKAYNKPVLVCCETYKFSQRVQTDSFVYNEIGDPDMLAVVDTLEESSPLVNWRKNAKLTPLNLLYDITPPDLVTGVVTELAILPCTSVPVILRIRPMEMG